MPPFALLVRYGGAAKWAVAGLTVAGATAWLISPWAAATGWAMATAIGLFFRCPDQPIPAEACVVAPADGVLDDMAILPGTASTPPTLKIGIFLSVLDVHVTRAPVDGRVVTKRFIPGRFSNAMYPRSARINQCNEIMMETAQGELLLLRQISGAIARRVIFQPEPGDTCRAGAVVGMIRFGSRTELHIPSGWVVTARPGMRVIAGRTVLAIRPK